MLKIERSQMMVELVRRLNQKGSWTGSTHIQKSTFFLQHLLSVPEDGYEQLKEKIEAARQVEAHPW